MQVDLTEAIPIPEDSFVKS